MALSYKKCWKLLIGLGMKQRDQKEEANASQNGLARLGRNQAVNMEALEKVYDVLDCDNDGVMGSVCTPAAKG